MVLCMDKFSFSFIFIVQAFLSANIVTLLVSQNASYHIYVTIGVHGVPLFL